MPRSFVAAPINEIFLASKVDEYSTEQSIPSMLSSLEGIAQKKGIEYATMYAKVAIENSPRNRGFLEEFRNLDTEICKLDLDAEIIVLPGLLYELVPEAGIDGKIVVDIAETLGLKAHFVPTLSRNSIEENVQIIDQTIRNIQSEKIIAISVSKGILNLRHWMSKKNNVTESHRIKGIMSLCGTPIGSALIDSMYMNFKRRLSTFLLSRFIKMPFRRLQSYGIDNAARSYEWFPADCVNRVIVNCPALPLPYHVRRPMVGRYRALASRGPNDGVVHLKDSVIPGGFIAPIYGVDHFLRSSEVCSYIYKFFKYMAKKV